MVFDSPLSRSRRSKSCDDKKQPEENKGANIAKREAKHRGRPRRSDKVFFFLFIEIHNLSNLDIW